MRGSARATAAATFAALAIPLAGCAALGSDDEVPQRVSGPTLVTKDQIERLPQGSPARALFEWWRALQFDNALVAAGYYTRTLHMTPDKLDRMLDLGAPSLGLTARLHLVEVDRNGNSATVFALLETDNPKPNGRIDKSQTARAFNLVREDDGWKLSDNRYLGRTLARVNRFSSGARRLQREGALDQGEGQSGERDQAAP